MKRKSLKKIPDLEGLKELSTQRVKNILKLSIAEVGAKRSLLKSGFVHPMDEKPFQERVEKLEEVFNNCKVVLKERGE